MLWACRQRCARYLEGALSLDGTLGKGDRQKRALFFYVNLMIAVSVIIQSLLNSREGGQDMLYFLAARLLSAAIALSVVVMILCRVKVSPTMVVVVAGIYSFMCFLADLSSRTIGDTRWPAVVLVVDLLLVMQVDVWYSATLVGFTLVWLLVMCAEESFRFGLLDIPGLKAQGGETGRRAVYEEQGSCVDLPCASGEGFRRLMEAAQVLVIDFLATRFFAKSVLKEQVTMEHTITAVQEIATLLAQYDVDGVARMLEAQGVLLPGEMHATLHKMEENLRKYRPYLPAALFEEEDIVPESTTHDAIVTLWGPPGSEGGEATIVFTDIRASTSIWEAAPEGMRAALKIHNCVLRDVMQAFCGYEVKTIGDSFMIAFAATAEGVCFGLRVQERLLEAAWPASLLEDAPICAPQGSLWGGLTVRIGVNSGPVTLEENQLTGRTDYFGHTVNVASRLESTCKPGAVSVPLELWETECKECTDVVASKPEDLPLKGVAGKTSVLCVWPDSLAERRATPLQEHSERTHSSIFVPTRRISMCTNDATVGVADLLVGYDPFQAIQNMDKALTTLTAFLDQSGGTVSTVLGNCVCVAWNAGRSAPAHVENAIRFAQRIHTTRLLNGIGLVTGPVQQGDVGARSRRFVTVIGRVVQASWMLCVQAGKAGRGVCLYETQETSFPSSLEHDLSPEGDDEDTCVYRVVVHNAEDAADVL